MKRYLLVFMAVVMIAGSFTGISAIAAAEEEAVSESELELIPEELFEIDDRGGTIHRIEGLDFQKPDITMSQTRVHYEYVPCQNDRGYYRFVPDNNNIPRSGSIMSRINLPLKPMTRYIVSVLVRTNFDRKHIEISAGLTVSNSGSGSDVRKVWYGQGLPSNTRETEGNVDGWYRHEVEICTDYQENPGFGGFISGIYIYRFNGLLEEDTYSIADMALIELPPVPPEDYGKGNGVTFRGGDANLGMDIHDTVETDDKISVTTTGAVFSFDKLNDTFSIQQRINKQRKVSSWKSNKSFKDLTITGKSENEVVICNDNVTFGVQMDSMLFVTPHNSDIELIGTSEIGGLWNRFAFGTLIVRDDIGGFTVTPDMPWGCGKTPQYEILTPNLDFIDKAEDLEFISNAVAPYSFKWTVSPGERLGIGTFPTRNYDWERSFDFKQITFNVSGSIDQYAIDAEDLGITEGTMWDFHQYGHAMSWGNRFYFQDDEQYRQHIQAAKDAGITPAPYMSLGFWYSRLDLDGWVSELKRVRDEFGIEGVYTDGIGVHDWVNVYQAIREAREVFPDGSLKIHNTGKPGVAGGVPISIPTINIPTIESYGDITLKMEALRADNFNWPYVRYMGSTYNSANSVATIKASYWTAGGTILTQPEWDLLSLEYNVRPTNGSRSNTYASWRNYIKILEQLKKEWELHGDKSDFFVAYYQPLVRSLIRPYIKKYYIKPTVDHTFDEKTDEAFAMDWYLYSKENTSVSLYDVEQGKCVRLKDDSSVDNTYMAKKLAPIGGPFTYEYKAKVGEGSLQQGILDGEGNVVVGLVFEDGFIKYYKENGESINLKAAQNGEWYSIKIKGDTDTDLCDVYINGERVLKDAQFNTKTHQIYSLIFRTAPSKQSDAYVDSVKLTDEL